jgi:hypothetical protein
MGSPQGRHIRVAALLLFTAACRSGDEYLDPYDAEKVVMKAAVRPGTPETPDAAAAEARAEAALAQAEAAWRSGDPLLTLATVSHALIEGVPPHLGGAFRDLRAKARTAVVGSKICRIRAVPERDAVADGAPVAVRIDFTNLSAATIRMPREQKGTSAATVVLQLAREDYDLYGNEKTSTSTLSVPLTEDVVLGPGATQPMPIVIPAEMMQLAHEGFSVVEVRGQFRPVAIQVGESEFFDAIPLETARVRVLMKGYEPLAEDPLGSLRKSVEKRSPPHLFTCVELLAPSDRAAAKALLEEAKKNDPELTMTVDAALARLAAAR